MSTGSNEEQIYDHFISEGYGSTAVAGILGNAYIESGFDPNAYNPGENAHGIFQWEGGRLTNLQNYAISHNGSITDLGTQLGYADWELHTGYTDADKAIRQASTPEEAAYAWASNFEGNDPSSDPDRENAAGQIYTDIRKGKLGKGIVTGSTGVSRSGPPPIPPSRLTPGSFTKEQRLAVVTYLESAAANGDIQPDGFAMSLITNTDWTTYQNDPSKLQADYKTWIDGSNFVALLPWEQSALEAYKSIARGDAVVPAGYQNDVKTTKVPQNWEAAIISAYDGLTSGALWKRIGMYALGGIILLIAVVKIVSGSGGIGKVLPV